MNGYFIFIVGMIVFRYGLDIFLDLLNVRAVRPEVPAAFIGLYDAHKYERSQQYLREKTRFGILSQTVSTALTIIFILFGGFSALDGFIRNRHLGEIVAGLAYIGILVICSQLIALPFHAYETFILEEKFGFNKTSPKTFITDFFKKLTVTTLLGGPLIAAILWFLTVRGGRAWVDCWITLTVFELFIIFIAPVTILPWFNTFTPLEAGPLRQEIEKYAAAQNFTLSGVFTIDGSRRSTRANAFFTGFGKFRRIALFDTLIRQHSIEELVAVLAHEIGHYKKRHILKMLSLSIFSNGVLFFTLSFFLNNRELFRAFGMDHVSVYASLVFAGFLFSPLQLGVGILSNVLSRKHEFEADAFSVHTYRQPGALGAALKKLTVDNLSNLTPHPWYAFVHYSHPPILRRLAALEEMTGTPETGDIPHAGG